MRKINNTSGKQFSRIHQLYGRTVKTLMLAVLMLSMQVTTAQAIDHASTFTQLPADFYRSYAPYYNAGTLWYLTRYNQAKYSNYQTLLEKYDRYIPSGSGLTILQAESKHTPDSIGNVKHLFRYEESNNHSETVANILSKADNYRIHYSRYRTYSVNLDNFHTSTTADLRKFFRESMSSANPYPTTDYTGDSIEPAKLLNISNTNGGSSLVLLRQFDKFVEENDLVACTAITGASWGNATTSGMAYNSIVVEQQYNNWYNQPGARYNDHGAPRIKPDIIAHHGGASSYSTPSVCSAAAVLLERANVDPEVSDAYNSIATKAILMAGATRFNYKASTEWGDGISQISIPLFNRGEWERSSDAQPLSPKYGAGGLNVLAAYNILDAGEHDPDGGQDLPTTGWSYQSGLAEGTTKDYWFRFDSEAMFSALMTWHREISDASGDDDYVSRLPDFKATLFDDEGNMVALSDNTTSNVELIETRLTPGRYRLEVRVKSVDGLPEASYALAWVSKQIAPEVVSVTTERTNMGYFTFSWELENALLSLGHYKYRLVISNEEDFSNVLEEVYLDNNSYTYENPESYEDLYFRVYTYPKDDQVAYQYPAAAFEDTTTALMLSNENGHSIVAIDSETFNFIDSTNPAGGFTQIYFVTESPEIGPMTGVWVDRSGNYSVINLPVVSDDGIEATLKLRGIRIRHYDDQVSMNTAQNYYNFADSKFRLEFRESDNAHLRSGRYTNREGDLRIIARGWDAPYQTTLRYKVQITVDDSSLLLSNERSRHSHTASITSDTFNFNNADNPAGGFTQIYFVAERPDIGPTTGVWVDRSGNYSVINLPVVSDDGTEEILKLRGIRIRHYNNQVSMRTAQNYYNFADSAFKLEYHKIDNTHLSSGTYTNRNGVLKIFAKGWEIPSYEIVLKYRVQITIDNSSLTLANSASGEAVSIDSETFAFDTPDSPAGGYTQVYFLAKSSNIGPVFPEWVPTRRYSRLRVPVVDEDGNERTLILRATRIRHFGDRVSMNSAQNYFDFTDSRLRLEYREWDNFHLDPGLYTSVEDLEITAKGWHIPSYEKTLKYKIVIQH